MPANPNKLSQFWEELKRRRVVYVFVGFATAAIILVSCSPQESLEAKAIREYIELNTDNPKTYEPVETIPAEYSSLYLQPDISNQLMNVENIEGRIYDNLESMNQTFHHIIKDSVKVVISELIHVYEENNLEKFKVARTYLNGAIAITIDFNRASNQAPEENRQHYLENAALFHGMVNRLQTEYNLLYNIMDQLLGIKDYNALTSAIENSELKYHKYRQEESGSQILKAGLFLMKDGKVNGAVPVEMSKL